ncbi:hypothetical protein [Rickettsia sp. TH2014]|nr:hypothetical protein [Rickettsia sp. TH2014]
MDTQTVIARSEAMWQSHEVITQTPEIASSKLTVFPRNDDLVCGECPL